MHTVTSTEQNAMQQKPQKTDKWTSSTGKAKVFTKSSIDCLLLHKAGKYYASAKVAGKIVRRSLDTDDYNVAKNRLPAVLAEIRGAHNASSSGTLGAAILAEANRFNPDHKPTTRKYYLGIAKSIVRASAKLPGNPLGMPLPRVHLAALRDMMVGYAVKYAASRYNGCLTLLRATYARAVESGQVAVNLPEDIKRLRGKTRKMDLPTSEGFAAIIASIAGSRRRSSKATAMSVEFLAYTGLRISEGRSLRWRDIKESKLVVRTAKNDEMRAVPLVAGALALIARMRASVLPTGAEDPVLTLRTPRFALRNACKRLGVDHMRVHDLRHMFATRCIESGVPLPTLAGWLGHRDGGVLCAQVYGHLCEKHSAEMAAKVVV